MPVAARLRRVGVAILNMIHPARFTIGVGFLFAFSLRLSALPVLTSSVDRDVARDPYTSFSLNLGKGPVIAVAGAAVASAFGSSLLPAGAAGFAGSSSINGFLTSSLPFSFVPPPRNPQVYFSLFDQPRQSNIQIGPVQVPDTGMTLLLLGVTLLPLILFAHPRVRRYARA
jgi:hypothetical protein